MSHVRQLKLTAKDILAPIHGPSYSMLYPLPFAFRQRAFATFSKNFISFKIFFDLIRQPHYKLHNWV